MGSEKITSLRLAFPLTIMGETRIMKSGFVYSKMKVTHGGCYVVARDRGTGRGLDHHAFPS